MIYIARHGLFSIIYNLLLSCCQLHNAVKALSNSTGCSISLNRNGNHVLCSDPEKFIDFGINLKEVEEQKLPAGSNQFISHPDRPMRSVWVVQEYFFTCVLGNVTTDPENFKKLYTNSTPSHWWLDRRRRQLNLGFSSSSSFCMEQLLPS